MAKAPKNTPKPAKARKTAASAGAKAPCRGVQGSPARRAAGSASSSVKGKTPAKNGSQAVVQNQAAAQAGVPAGLARILRPGAAMQWTLPSLAAMTPQYIESVLTGALSGNHVQQWELFDMMLDTWPELAACQSELIEGVLAMTPTFTPWAEEGEPPTDSAVERQKLVSSALRRMRPEAVADEADLSGTIRDIANGFLCGVTMSETHWHAVNAGKLGRVIAPRATTWAHPSFFGWSAEGRLGLRTQGGIAELPPHKFLIGIHKAKAGSALGGAMLRPLAWWWCAANFASDWLLNLAQLFGLPFRWANHDPNASQETIDAICNMLQNMGSAGWAAFPAGTTLELKDTGATGDRSPQGDLLDRADRYARMLILGQTMSGSQDSSKGGGKAFGAVEADVKNARTDACGKYVCEALNSQLITSILELNYGEADECPQMALVPDREAGADEITRDEALARLMPIPLSYLRAKYKVPEPGLDEETTTAHPKPADEEALYDFEDDLLEEDESDDEEDDIDPDEETGGPIKSRGASARIKPGKSFDPAKPGKSKRKKLVRGSSRIPTGSGAAFDPNQKRIPKGQPNAGRWMDDGMVSKGQRARRGVMRDATDADRKNLKIPPGYKNAKVTDDPKADLIATAVNEKGKPISIYTESYSKKQEAAKFARISALHKEMPGLQKQITADAQAGNHQALTMRLITASGMRNGGDKGGGKVDTFGASNLRTSQVRVEGNKIHMDFVGKKGVRQRHSIEDTLLSKHVSERIAGGHATVFDGNAGKTLGYLTNISKGQFKVHDFRTWNATITADRTISRIQSKGQLPSNETEYKAFQMRVAKVVSRKLGNDPAMALKAYIHPAVFNGY